MSAETEAQILAPSIRSAEERHQAFELFSSSVRLGKERFEGQGPWDLLEALIWVAYCDVDACSRIWGELSSTNNFAVHRDPATWLRAFLADDDAGTVAHAYPAHHNPDIALLQVLRSAAGGVTARGARDGEFVETPIGFAWWMTNGFLGAMQDGQIGQFSGAAGPLRPNDQYRGASPVLLRLMFDPAEMRSAFPAVVKPWPIAKADGNDGAASTQSDATTYEGRNGQKCAEWLGQAHIAQRISELQATLSESKMWDELKNLSGGKWAADTIRDTAKTTGIVPKKGGGKPHP